MAAFEALYERYHLALLSFSRHMLGRAHDAEDVVQHTFMAADRAFRGGKAPKAVRAWLYTVARNRCVSVLRARREDAGLPDAGIPSTENLAVDVEQREDLRQLLADLRTLPDDQRAALLLAELGDLTHTEVAKVIGVRPGKVKALVFQARETLLASAHARAIPCRSIQEELANASGAALRRRHLRNHLAQCEGCRDFAAGVRAQRAALAAILPVVPTLALRDGILAGLGTGGAAAGASAGIGVLAAKSTAAKLLTTIAVGGAAVGGGGVAVTAIDAPDPRRAVEQRAPASERGVAPGAVGPQGAGAERSATVERGGGAARFTAPGRERGQARAEHRARRAGPGQERGKDRALPPGQERKEQRGLPPGHAKQQARGKTPPGQARKQQRAAPLGQARKQQARLKAPNAAKPKSGTAPRQVKAPKATSGGGSANSQAGAGTSGGQAKEPKPTAPPLALEPVDAVVPPADDASKSNKAATG